MLWMFSAKLISCHPSPIYLIQTDDTNRFIEWLYQPERENELRIDYLGTVYRFRSPGERIAWAQGFQKAIELRSKHGQSGFYPKIDQRKIG